MVRAGAPTSVAEYGGNAQSQAQCWIEDITGEAFQGSFEDHLRDGVKLCELINKIKPGAVRRINPYKEGQKFKQMENISNFIRACRALGVPEYSLFETVDLYEGKDVALVVKCLHALGGAAQLNCPDFPGPHLGLKPFAKTSGKTRNAPSSSATSAPSVRSPSTAVSNGPGGAATRPPPPPYQGTAQPPAAADKGRSPPPAYQDISSRFAESAIVTDRRSGGTNSVGANGDSSSRGTRLQPPPYSPKASSDDSKQQRHQKAPSFGEGMPSAGGSGNSQDQIGTKASSAQPASGSMGLSSTAPARVTARGGGFGLDAELAAKREANYDYNAEAEAQEWIEDVTGEPFASDFAEELKNGKRLCDLINRIKPGAVRKVNDSRMPFKQMENISNFLKACRAVGVAEYSLFETVDLFEGKDLGLVVRCLHALGQTVQTSCPDFDGPRLGIRQTESNKRDWTPEQQQKQVLSSSGAMSQLMAGSSKTMERGTISKTGVTFGAAQSGTGDRSATSGWTMGSAKTMDRSHVSKSGPTFGAEYAGPSGDRAGVSSQLTGGRRGY